MFVSVESNTRRVESNMPRHCHERPLVNDCIRACAIRNRHADDCDDPDRCNGCATRPAEYGNLCWPDHKRLDEMLRQAPEQHHLLLVMAGERAPSATDTDADLIHGSGPAYATPVRLGCIDVAQELQDVLSDLVERLIDNYRMVGPPMLQTAAERDDPRRRVYSPSAGYYWAEGRARWHVDRSAPWLRAQIERLEHEDSIGEDWGTLADAMSRAHALAPWRPAATRMHGIPCPTCQRKSLTLFGGDESITCASCRECITPSRYAIWVRMLEAEVSAATA